jgi:hypothetical protein
LNWFKKGSKNPRKLPTVQLFTPYPNTLALALVAPVLLDRLEGRGIYGQTPDINPIPDSFETPYGLYKYVDVSKLSLVDIICINETGTIIPAQIRSIYFEHVLINLANGLNLELEIFFKTIIERERTIIAGVERVDPPRLLYSTPQEAIEATSKSKIASKPAIIVNIDSSLYSPTQACNPLRIPAGEYFFSYWTTTTDPTTMLNMTSLEINTKSCINDNQLSLPLGGGWESNFLQPIFSHIRAKLNHMET